MSTGQAERLMPLLEALLTEAGLGWRDLAVLGVGTGPGNFTGIRIAVAAARGLALGLGIPAVGISAFDAADPEGGGSAIVPAPRGLAYVRSGDQAPGLVTAEAAAALPRPLHLPEPAAMILCMARLARARAGKASTRPAPLYVRPADAAPARDRPPPILP